MENLEQYSKKGLKSFLMNCLNDATLANLIQWTNRANQEFKILWLHGGNQTYQKGEHDVIFMKYRQYRDLKTSKNDPKQSFRMAMKKSPDVERMKEREDSDDWRIYKFKSADTNFAVPRIVIHPANVYPMEPSYPINIMPEMDYDLNEPMHDSLQQGNFSDSIPFPNFGWDNSQHTVDQDHYSSGTYQNRGHCSDMVGTSSFRGSFPGSLNSSRPDSPAISNLIYDRNWLSPYRDYDSSGYGSYNNSRPESPMPEEMTLPFNGSNAVSSENSTIWDFNTHPNYQTQQCEMQRNGISNYSVKNVQSLSKSKSMDRLSDNLNSFNFQSEHEQNYFHSENKSIQKTANNFLQLPPQNEMNLRRLSWAGDNTQSSTFDKSLQNSFTDIW